MPSTTASALAQIKASTPSSVSQDRGSPCQNIGVVLPPTSAAQKQATSAWPTRRRCFPALRERMCPLQGSVAKSNRACVGSGLDSPNHNVTKGRSGLR